MSRWTFVVRILIQQALLRVVRIKGQAALARKGCQACPHLDLITKDADAGIDAVETLGKLMKIYAQAERNKTTQVEVRSGDNDTLDQN